MVMTQMKGITCCGDCGYYNWKKHKCTRATDEGDARDKFYADCPLPDVVPVQEPRVMTYDELATFDGAFLIESSAISQLDWVFFFDTDTKSDAIWVEGFDEKRCVVYREDYGTYTRCWTLRPTDAQREATPWN